MCTGHHVDFDDHDTAGHHHGDHDPRGMHHRPVGRTAVDDRDHGTSRSRRTGDDAGHRTEHDRAHRSAHGGAGARAGAVARRPRPGRTRRAHGSGAVVEDRRTRPRLDSHRRSLVHDRARSDAVRS